MAGVLTLAFLITSIETASAQDAGVLFTSAGVSTSGAQNGRLQVIRQSPTTSAVNVVRVDVQALHQLTNCALALVLAVAR